MTWSQVYKSAEGGRALLKPERHYIKFSQPDHRAKFVLCLSFIVHLNLVIAAGQGYGPKVYRPSHVIDVFKKVTGKEGIISCFFIEISVIRTQS